VKEANHPIWSLLRLSVLMIALCVVLKLEARSFDITEIRSICWMFIAAACLEGGMFLFLKKFKE